MMVCLLLDRWQKQIYKKNFHLEKDQAIFPSIPSHFSLVTVFFLGGVRHHPILFTLFQLPFSSVFIILLFPFFLVLSLLCPPPPPHLFFPLWHLIILSLIFLALPIYPTVAISPSFETLLFLSS